VLNVNNNVTLLVGISSVGRLNLCALGSMSQKVDSSLEIMLCFLQKLSRFLIILAVRSGFLAAQRDGRPSFFWQTCWMLHTDMSPNPITSFLISLAILNGK
jgi:hypothetical protein